MSNDPGNAVPRATIFHETGGRSRSPASISPATERSAAAEKMARYRLRRKAGIVVVQVELTPGILELLAFGMGTTVEALRADRQRLAIAARRGLRHLEKRWRELDDLP